MRHSPRRFLPIIAAAFFAGCSSLTPIERLVIAQEAAPEIAGKLPDGDEQIGVFLPCTPNPTTGFFFYLPRREVVELSISVEDGAKLIMSAGLTHPAQPISDGAK